MKSRVMPLLAALGLLTLALIWWEIWREPIWAVDDLYFGKRSLNEAGHLDWGTLLTQIPNDLLVRNGRIADIFGELIFATGNGKSIIVVALLLATHVAFFTAADRLVANTIGRTPRSSVRIFLGILAACFPFLLLWRQPAIAGSTLLFMSATVGYFGGVIYIGAIITLSASVAHREFSRIRSAVILGLVILGSLHHEVIGLMVAAWWATMLVVTDFRHVARRNKIIVISSIVLSLARFALPGMWQRSGKVHFGFAWPETSGPLGDHVHQVLRYVGYASHLAIEILVVYWPFVLIFFVAAAALIYRAQQETARDGWSRVIPPAIVICTLAAIGFALRLHQRIPADRNDAMGFYHLVTSRSFMAFIVAVFVLVLAFAASWPLRRRLGAVYALLALTAGASAIPAALDTVAARPTFFVAVMVLLAPTVVMAIWLDHSDITKPVRLGTVAVAIVLTIVVSIQADRQVVRYHHDNAAVWRNIEAQILAVQAGERTTFELPKRLPHPHYLPDYIGTSVNAKFYIIEYYHLPVSTQVYSPPTAESTAANE
ncbi:MAG: hypothetical protein Q4P36_07420 [Bowdeniella nasicola]|nr:hypothetical protein [Bowdeniella nasicola]